VGKYDFGVRAEIQVPSNEQLCLRVDRFPGITIISTEHIPKHANVTRKQYSPRPAEMVEYNLRTKKHRVVFLREPLLN